MSTGKCLGCQPFLSHFKRRTQIIFSYYITLLFSLLQLLANSKQYLRPLSSAVISQSQTLAAQNTTPVALLPQIRSFQTSPVTRDIDSAAKFIGAGAATVGVAGSGSYWLNSSAQCSSCPKNRPLHKWIVQAECPLCTFIIFSQLQSSIWGTHNEYLITLNNCPGKVWELVKASPFCVVELHFLAGNLCNHKAKVPEMLHRRRCRCLTMTAASLHWNLSWPAILVRCACCANA